MIVNPAGTGTPSCVISASPIPLPPEKLPPALGWLVEVVHVGHLWAILLAWPSSTSSRWAAAARPMPWSARCSPSPAVERPRVLYVGTASAEDPRNALIMYERARGQADVTPLQFFPWPPADLRELDARPGRDLRRRRQHREHARDLARPRLRPDPPRGLGAGDRALRQQRRDDLLVRGERDGFVRAAARGDERRPRVPARERLPALRRRGAAPPALPAGGRRAASRPATPPTRASASTSSARSSSR